MNTEGQEPLNISLPITYTFPANLLSRYANNVVVVPGQQEITIAFFEVQMPILMGNIEEMRLQLTQIGAAPAECVSRIIVTPEVLRDVIRTLQRGLDIYESVHQSNEQEEE